MGGRGDKEEEAGLVEKNLLQSKEIGTAPGGQPKRAYALTLKGLGWTLRNYRREAWERIDRIAEKQAGLLPRIFGNWKLFKEEGVAEEVFKCLIDPKFAVSNDPDLYLDALFSNLFEKFPPGEKGEQLYKLFQVFKEDEELAGEARTRVRKICKELRAELKTVERIRDRLEG
ncbi:hypothetical protein AKJ41_03610 [candidate division MSBL1 archaeon SCGC-AAA259O05]|uniref:Uncharacterized protein n=1 Tax=candidate division MSBL1 archaeon SCGC-AAA259O05 TaxID=1698271 RepID=A0A133V310_9EURY|nr:hypothetical protein AKJ41_03610 [candidate division MSBL1 archaeon SCGC-AAA259O05]